MAAPSIYSSPKRKRSEFDLSLDAGKTLQDPYSPALTPAADDKTKFHTYPFPEAAPDYHNGSGSPRSAVAGQLSGLDIHGDFVRRLDFGGVANKKARLKDDQNDASEDVTGPSGKGKFLDTRDEVHDTSTAGDEQPDGIVEGIPGEQATIMIQEVASSVSKAGSESPIDPSEPTTPTTTPPKHNSKAQPRSRKKSPPLSGPEEDPLTWHDSEITGHIAADEDDDGYGINGIGFRPTTAQAYQRSLKRKQQIKEWMKREQGEERRRRGQRRRGGDGGEASGERRGSDGKKGVRFEVTKVNGRE